MKKIISILLITCIGLVIIAVYQYSKFSDGKLHIVVCDVGQGDAIFIRTPEKKKILYDGGPDNSVLSCLSNHMPFWDRTIDLVILSHPHADHFMGLKDVVERYEVKALVTEQLANNSPDYIEFIKQVKHARIPIRYVLAGDTFKLPDTTELQVLHPSREYLFQTSSDGYINEKREFASLIMKVSYGAFRMLLTGDSQKEGIKRIKNISSVSVLQVPHHGSASGLDQDVLALLQPRVAMISVGKNSYGHPTQSILTLLGNNKIKMLRTDQDGDIEVIVDKNGWQVR